MTGLLTSFCFPAVLLRRSRYHSIWTGPIAFPRSTNTTPITVGQMCISLSACGPRLLFVKDDGSGIIDGIIAFDRGAVNFFGGGSVAI